MLIKKLLIILVGVSLLNSCASMPETESLDQKMNQWHTDVAEFRLDEYFDFMSDSFIFLGTAPGERWPKEEFYEFSKPYFDKKSTWDFKVTDRHWYYSMDGKTAWFEENLDTWMEDCRGSGVLINKNNEWKITHYNLTVLIENEKIQEFISIRKSKDKNLSSSEN
ncbi:MAG: nuclear transport factor 2 family protein [Crocinitomicaceae bacterium]